MEALGADPVDDAVSLEHRHHVWLHPGEAQRRPLRSDQLVDLCELLGTLRIDERDRLEVEDTARSELGSSSVSARMRSSSAWLVAKKRPLSSRSTATPGKVSSPGCWSRSRNTCVPASRPRSGIGGLVAT